MPNCLRKSILLMYNYEHLLLILLSYCLQFRTATLTLVLVAALIVALCSIDSALSYVLALLLRKSAWFKLFGLRLSATACKQIVLPVLKNQVSTTGFLFWPHNLHLQQFLRRMIQYRQESRSVYSLGLDKGDSLRSMHKFVSSCLISVIGLYYAILLNHWSKCWSICSFLWTKMVIFLL